MKITEGKWVQYKTQPEHKELIDSLKGRNTGWDSLINYSCTFEEGILNPKTFRRKLYCNCYKISGAEQLMTSEYHIYYSNNKNREAKIPRILLEISNNKITKIRGISYGQNIDPYMVNTLELKLDEIERDWDKFREILLDIKTLNNIERKYNCGEDLTSDELVFIYELRRPIKYFGLYPDGRVNIIKNGLDNNQGVYVNHVDAISVELGYGLDPLIDTEYGTELSERIIKVRSDIAKELGVLVPRVVVVDNMKLEPAEYYIKIKGNIAAKGKLNLGQYLAIDPDGKCKTIPGNPTLDPTFGEPAIWINADVREVAERAGYIVADSPAIITTHLYEVISKYAYEIIGRQEVRVLIDSLNEDYPVVVDEVNKEYQIGDILKILQGLLAEQVSIRDIVSILETLCDFAGVSKETGFLIEKVRQRLKRQICQK